MHRCLKVPEIINYIVYIVGLDLREDSMIGIVYKEKRKAALAVALTCKEFMEPGLDTLWHSMDSLTPLLRFLVHTDTVTTDYLKKFNMQTVTQDVVSAFATCFRGPGMKRFLYYCGRIKYLRVSSQEGFPAIIFDLLRVAQQSDHPLFLQHENPILLTPSLRGLSWIHPDNRTLPYIDFFASPLLQRFSITIYPWTGGGHGALERAMTCIRHSCPQIDGVDINNDEAEAGAKSLLAFRNALKSEETKGDPFNFRADFVVLITSALPSLRRVRISSEVSIDALTCLSQLPLLQKLRAEFYDDMPPIRGIPSSLKFAALQSLSLANLSLPGYEVLIRSLSFPENLITLKLEYAPAEGPAVIENFFQTVSRYCSPHKLETIDLRVYCDCPLEEDDHPLIPIIVISPLLSFRAMSSFTLGVCNGLCNDEFVERLAVAWPELVSFLLFLDDPPSKFSFHSLYHLAKHCPRLRWIHIPLEHSLHLGPFPKRDWEHERLELSRPVTLIPRPLLTALNADEMAYLEDIFPGIIIQQPTPFICA